jgi:hypothetical protein
MRAAMKDASGENLSSRQAAYNSKRRKMKRKPDKMHMVLVTDHPSDVEKKAVIRCGTNW